MEYINIYRVATAFQFMRKYKNSAIFESKGPYL